MHQHPGRRAEPCAAAPGRVRRATAWCVLGTFLGSLPGSPALAGGLEGGRVLEGDASVATEGDNTTITTRTRETIMEWDRFDVPVEEQVRIDQPDAGSRILKMWALPWATPEQILPSKLPTLP